MTVGSGRQCSMLFETSSPLGRFSKILLESSAWTSSEEYCHVWNRLDTKFALSAFQLTPLGQSTEDSGCSLWRSPTGTEDNGGGTNGHDRLAQGHALRLRDQVKTPKLWPTATEHGNYNKAGLSERSGNGLATAAKLWPTPCVQDTGRETVAAKLWPTPRAAWNAGRHHGQPDSLHSAAKLWPTPVVNDARNGRNETANRSNPESNHHAGTTLSDAIRMADSTSGSLNPRFVEQLMGFEIDHTALKRSAMPSCPSKPSRSSRRSRS
jgi:hypothetical protein